ncbi:MAG: L-seryl-tRNA(Sec) selenium transferase [Myxococcales bacterium]|nr:L-seryl-tRNA(Sec) selenium transferase [Myxococcales bacterium]
MNALLRGLPKVDEVLRQGAAVQLLSRAPRWAVVAAIRDEIDGLRGRLLAGGEPGLDAWEIGGRALEDRVDRLLRPSLTRVLNATGVVLHTNLGRAPLAAAAIARVEAVARGYCNLEYRLDERRRGSRHEHIAALLGSLTGAEAALVVNNNAAAVLLALAGLAAGREVIVSRGELVEIGGSFRIPDVMRASGARLVEVGTTNRTHARDYERAITAETALLLKVHQSNFAQIGFTAEVSVADLVAIGRARGVPTVVDLGSGSLIPSASLGAGIEAEPTSIDLVAAGADLVTCSGDKLLGGPQAGLLLGRTAVIERLRTNPLLRALRPDKMTLAALEATLELYRDGRAAAEVPTLVMLGAPHETLRARAMRLLELLRTRAPWLSAQVIEVRSAVGGGALPRSEPPSFAVAVTHPRLTSEALDARLRAAEPPLVARIADGHLLADVRTLTEGDLELAAAAFATTSASAQEPRVPGGPSKEP